MFVNGPQWILTGSLDSWGNPIVASFDLVIFIQTPQEIRLQRLRQREEGRFGKDAVA